jgi:hypothetical protein
VSRSSGFDSQFGSSFLIRTVICTARKKNEKRFKNDTIGHFRGSLMSVVVPFFLVTAQIINIIIRAPATEPITIPTIAPLLSPPSSEDSSIGSVKSSQHKGSEMREKGIYIPVGSGVVGLVSSDGKLTTWKSMTSKPASIKMESFLAIYNIAISMIRL